MDDEQEFKSRVRISTRSFQYILNIMFLDIEKIPTNLNTFSIKPDRQLSITLHQLANGCTYSTLANLFGVSVFLASETSNKVAKALVDHIYDPFVKMPDNDGEWWERE